jgi:hypothetical protein
MTSRKRINRFSTIYNQWQKKIRNAFMKIVKAHLMWHILDTICFRGFSLPVHHLNIITTAIHKTNAETWSLTLKEKQRLRVLRMGC